MMLKNKIFKNASWMIGCKLAQSVLSFIVTILTARYFGPSNYGVITYAASIVAFAAPIVQLGLGNIQVQELVSDPENEGKIVGTTLGSSLISACFCVLGVAAFSMVANASEKETIVVCVLYSTILFFQGAELLQYWFQARYMSKYASIVSLIAFVVVTAYRIFLLASGKGIYWFAVANALDYVMITFSLLAVYHKAGGQKISFSMAMAKRMLHKSKHYIIANMMITIFLQTDRVMLKHMLSDAATGIYAAAAACAGLANFVYAAIIDSYRPFIFEKHGLSREAFNKSMTQLYAIIIYLSVIACLAVTVLAKYIILIIYGQAYIDAVEPLRLAVWYSTFSYVGMIRNIWILAEGQQKYLWMINLSGVLSNIILNYVLIPVWGVSGAAFASLFTQFFANVVVTYLIPAVRENITMMLKALHPKVLLSVIRKLDGHLEE